MRTDTCQDDETPGIDMAPMIDCVFLLLIFFIVAATIRKKHMELPIELPSTGSAIEKKADDQTLVVSVVSRDGGVSYALTTVGERTRSGGGAQEYLTLQPLIEALKQSAEELPDRAVRIDADVGVPYGSVAQVVDHLEVYGLRRIALRTRDR